MHIVVRCCADAIIAFDTKSGNKALDECSEHVLLELPRLVDAVFAEMALCSGDQGFGGEAYTKEELHAKSFDAYLAEKRRVQEDGGRRGKCGKCGSDVFSDQPRVKTPSEQNGLVDVYFHTKCYTH